MTFGDTATRVLLSVATQPRPTVRSVADEVGTTVGNVHQHLSKLRAEGLVTWEDGQQGTLRLACGFVPVVARTPVRIAYDDSTAHASGTGAALTRNPAPWSARPLSRRANDGSR